MAMMLGRIMILFEVVSMVSVTNSRIFDDFGMKIVSPIENDH